MDSVSLVRSLLDAADQALEEVLADVTPEQAHWQPSAKALPIGALCTPTP